jgi:hypothetical protein
MKPATQFSFEETTSKWLYENIAKLILLSEGLYFQFFECNHEFIANPCKNIACVSSTQMLNEIVRKCKQC